MKEHGLYRLRRPRRRMSLIGLQAILTTLVGFNNAIAFGQSVDAANLLLTDVHLVSALGDAYEEPVNILIQDGAVELVSPDEIPAPQGVVFLDARGGYLLGNLELGGSPSIVVVDADPRSNFDVLLDTEKHAVFALHDGTIARNRLTAHAAPVQPTKTLSWLAYEPPPMALPAHYGTGQKFNHWNTKNTTGAFLVAGILDRQRWLTQDSASKAQVGDLGTDFDGGEIRAMSFGVVGSLNYFRQPWVYTIFGATNAYDKGFETEDLDEFVWIDYRLDVPLSEKLSLSLGRQKEPISMERLSGTFYLPMQERSVAANGLLPARNFGAVLSGTSPREQFSWAGGLFRDVIESDESWANTPTQIVGRVTWVPWSTTDDSHLIHLGLGYRHTDAKLGVRFHTRPEFNKAPDFVDTGTIDADNADLINAEFSWRRGPYWLSAEYMGTRVETPLDGTLAFNGYNVTLSWAITGEMRPYNRRRGLFQPLPVSRSVNQNGWGAWELALRWSDLDLVDGPIDGGEIEVLSLGVNWWLTRTLHVSFNLRQAQTDRDGLSGDSTGLAGRILLLLD